MIARLTALALTLSFAAGQPLHADEQPVVVELFTSQGCSNCPPADALLRELAQREDVLALALHVDYWDYIGWADSFAQPAFTARQKGYAYAAGASGVYTPQMIIDGEDHVVGFRPMQVAKLLEKHNSTDNPVELMATREGNVLMLEASATRALEKAAVIQIVRYLPRATVEIERGENAGRTITYANIVQDWEEIARWDGAEPLARKYEIKAQGPLAVIVQEEGFGPVLAAARLD